MRGDLMKIKAVGFCNEKRQSIVYEDGKFNGDYPWLEFLLTEGDVKPIGGTYFPERNSPLHIYDVLRFHYFDKLISIEVEGDLGVIPCENIEGIVY